MTRLKKILIALFVTFAVAGPMMPAARADEYHVFPIGSTGVGMVCQITDGCIIWMWYDANGNWGYLGVQSY